MTLARIITHSDLGARELAFHLLGRGYAVEIVSPDSVPDNFADLELRVDADSGDQLVASLAAYEGQRVSGLEFVPRVKTPIEEVTLTPPVRGDAPEALGDPVVINVSPAISDTGVSADSFNDIFQPMSWRAEAVIDREPSPDLRGPEAEHLPPTEEAFPLSILDTASDIAPVESLPSNVEQSATIAIERTVEPLSYFARQISSIALPFAGPAVALPTWEQQTVDRPLPWKFIAPAALTLSAAVLLSLFLAFGVRASAKPSIGSSTPIRTAAVSANSSSLVSGKGATTVKPGAGLHIASRPNTSSRHAADVIAPDTVTYLDKRYKPAAKPKSVHAGASSIRRAKGDVAADTTTYFSSAASPQPRK